MKIRILTCGANKEDLPYPRIVIHANDGTVIEEDVTVEDAELWIPLVLSSLKKG